MSDTGEDLDVLHKAKALWLKTHINYETRSSRTGKAVDKAVSLTSTGTPATEGERKALRERLRSLRERAVTFSSLAMEDDHRGLVQLIAQVTRQIDLRDWGAAQTSIEQAERLVTDGQNKLSRLVELRERCDGLPFQISRIGNQHDAEELGALIDRIEPIRLMVTPPRMELETAANALDVLDRDVETQRRLLAERRGRVDTMHLERQQLIEDLNELLQRATETEGDAVALLQPIAKLVTTLQGLAGERVERTLADALEEARQTRVDLTARTEEAEQAKDLRDRRALLPGLAKQLEQIKSGYVGARKAGHPTHVKELDRLAEAARVLIGDVEAADVTGVLALLKELQGQNDYMVEESARIVKDQQRMRRALEAYKGFLKTPPESGFWGDLKSAYSQLPKAISEQGSAFATAPAWAYEDRKGYADVEEFLRLSLVVSASEQGEAERQAYVDALNRREDLQALLKTLRRHATPPQLTTITNALNSSKTWLDDVNIDRLTDKQKSDVGDLLDTVENTLDEIETARGNAQTEAQLKDSNDGGHSIQRHGPDVEDKDLQDRLKTGYAPGGKVFSPTRKSCKFSSYGEWETTRNAAFARAETLLGRSFGPKRDQNGGGGPVTFTLDHGRVVGEGFEGVGAGTYKANPKGGGGGQVFSTFVPLPGLTHTKSTIEWDGKHWVAIQHFPTN